MELEQLRQSEDASMARGMIGSEFSAAEQKELDRIKGIILGIVPDAEQVVSYGMPTFKYKKKLIMHIGAFSDHMSVFPGAAAVEAFSDRLVDQTTSKGTIQFTLERPLADQLIRDITRFRLRAIQEELQ